MKFPYLFLITIVLFLSALGLAAQTKITEKKLNEIDAKGTELLKSTPYRLIRKVEFFEDIAKTGTVWETFRKEYVSESQWHFIYEKFGDEPMSRERLQAGKQIYARRKSGEWVREEDLNEILSSGPGEFLPQDLRFGKVNSSSHAYRGKVDLDGKKADLYVFSEERILDALNDNKHLLFETRYWFGTDSRLLKKIEEIRTKGKKALKRTTTTIDYDTAIKIDAPIMAAADGYIFSPDSKSFKVNVPEKPTEHKLVPSKDDPDPSLEDVKWLQFFNGENRAKSLSIYSQPKSPLIIFEAEVDSTKRNSKSLDDEIMGFLLLFGGDDHKAETRSFFINNYKARDVVYRHNFSQKLYGRLLAVELPGRVVIMVYDRATGDLKEEARIFESFYIPNK